MAGSRQTDTFGPVRSRLIAVAEYLRARPLPPLRRRRDPHRRVPPAVPARQLARPLHRAPGGSRLADRGRGGGLRRAARRHRPGARRRRRLRPPRRQRPVARRWRDVRGGHRALARRRAWASDCWATATAGRSRGRSTRRTARATRSTGWSGRRRCSTPSGGPAAVARAICDVALETFDCDLVALFAIEGERLRLLARSPFLAKTGERLIMEPSFELQQELAENLLPQFIHDVREPFGPRVPRAITADPEQVSAIRAPVLLDEQPVALLAMSWTRRHARARARRTRRRAALRRARRGGARPGAARPGAAGRGRAVPPVPGEPLAGGQGGDAVHQGRHLLPPRRGAHAARRGLHRRGDAAQRVGGRGHRRRHRPRPGCRGARRQPPRRLARPGPPRRVPAGEHEDARTA